VGPRISTEVSVICLDVLICGLIKPAKNIQDKRFRRSYQILQNVLNTVHQAYMIKSMSV
jgi:hypothetical protein